MVFVTAHVALPSVDFLGLFYIVAVLGITGVLIFGLSRMFRSRE